MKFPEGRLYTVQFTHDELIWLLEQDLLWKNYIIGTSGDRAIAKIHKANEDRQQDNAIAYLYESTVKRNDWLSARLVDKVSELETLRGELAE